ncbi:MAG: MarR family winged helix-turn-helix transcriptional regulator [Halioglobus sp.]|nr:MarR family winged helix-turn-helix transcriptional regulator [Halioglobus sp.]
MHKDSHRRQEIGQTLMLMARDFQQRLDRDLHRRGVEGIGSRHRAIFLFLGRNGASRAVDLAEAAGIRPQSMMKIVHELESLQLVERSEDPNDSRAKLIQFTAQGRQLIVELSHSTETVWQQYADILGDRELENTFEHLNTLLCAGERNSE